MFELILMCPQEQVEDISDALDALDALSVSVEDMDAQTESEQPLFGEPGMPAPKEGWQRSLLTALFAVPARADDVTRIPNFDVTAHLDDDGTLARSAIARHPAARPPQPAHLTPLLAPTPHRFDNSVPIGAGLTKRGGVQRSQPSRPPINSSTAMAPALSSGSLPLPHLGDWMHAGQPSSQAKPVLPPP